MPDVPRVPPGRRCFARIDRFECACPACGRLIFAGIDRTFLPKRLVENNRARAAAKQRPRAASVLRLMWNPYTQRLKCPWCDHVYTLGVVFYPVPRYKRRDLEPAPDIIPNDAEVAEMARLAGGWFVKGGREPGSYANLVVTAPCSCPHQGIDPWCRLHGNLTLGGESRGPEPPEL